MTISDTQNLPETDLRREDADNNLRALDKVRAIFTSLLKYISTKTIYSGNNPNVRKFAEALYRTVREYFEIEKELLLEIEQYQIKWRDQIVYDNLQNSESLAFLFFKDGVGEITFLSSVTPDELDRFAELIKSEIFNPSVHIDVVNRLWEAEFKNIFYRVYDEYTDGTSGEGQGSQGHNRHQLLRVNDHHHLPNIEDDEKREFDQTKDRAQSIHAHFVDVMELRHPSLDIDKKELCVQKMFETFFIIDDDKLKSWRDEFYALDNRDKLHWLLNILFDFTQMQSPPPIARDILDMSERLVRNITEEANTSSLIALINAQKKLEHSSETAFDYKSLPGRIESELTNKEFLLSLGKTADRSQSEIYQLLLFFQMLGKRSLPGMLELIKTLKDPSMHKECCDILLDIAGDDIMQVIDNLDLDELQEAKNAIYLLTHSKIDMISTVIKKLMSSTHVEVRELLAEYLVSAGNEETALMLFKLLEDKDASVRIKAFAAVEEFKHALIIDKVTSLCFEGDNSAKDMAELERMFRSAGKLAGTKILGQIKQMVRKKIWLPFKKNQYRKNKLLAIAALRHIPGQESIDLLMELSKDQDGTIRNKALYALKMLQDGEEAYDEEMLSVAGKEIE